MEAMAVRTTESLVTMDIVLEQGRWLVAEGFMTSTALISRNAERNEGQRTEDSKSSDLPGSSYHSTHPSVVKIMIYTTTNKPM